VGGEDGSGGETRFFSKYCTIWYPYITVGDLLWVARMLQTSIYGDMMLAIDKVQIE
jgi:hypothetical protein